MLYLVEDLGLDINHVDSRSTYDCESFGTYHTGVDESFLLLNAALFFALENPWYNMQSISGPLAIAPLAYSIITKDYKWLCYAAGAAKMMAYMGDSLDTSISDVKMPEIGALALALIGVIGESPLTMTAMHNLAEFVNKLIKPKDTQTSNYQPQIDVADGIIMEEPAGISDLNDKNSLAYQLSKIITNALANAFLIWDPSKPITRNLWPAIATYHLLKKNFN